MQKILVLQRLALCFAADHPAILCALALLRRGGIGATSGNTSDTGQARRGACGHPSTSASRNGQKEITVLVSRPRRRRAILNP